ncbi:hypothetical protein [Niabella sp.]|uniref:hypothetical protein n=1 Tax=Niabella sp. TaxID=1962976 RepID=UPI00260D7C7C|nr:hypothetical protein [Niabella sp.]
MKIDSVDEEGFIYVAKGALTLKISLDNLRKDYARDKDMAVITDFVKTMASHTLDLPASWEEAKDDVYISLFPDDYAFEDFLNEPVTEHMRKVYIHRRPGELTWVSDEDLKKWNITPALLAAQADQNANKLLQQVSITIDTVEGHKLGFIDTAQTTLKGALLFASGMKEKIKADFGFPFYAVIPVRDFCYLFSEEDFNFFSKRLAPTVVEEYKQSGYPVTTEILKFSNKGVDAVGRYPVQ